MDEHQREGGHSPQPDHPAGDARQPDEQHGGNVEERTPPESDSAHSQAHSQARGGRRRSALSRRDFLRAAAWTAVGLLGSQMTLVEQAAASTLMNVVLPPGLQVSDKVVLKRRNDLLDLEFEFYNMQRMVSIQTGDTVLQRINTSQPAYMVVIFPSQAMAERTFAQGQPLKAPLNAFERASAGKSRLAFQLPGDLNTLPYTTQALLTWTSFIPRLVPTALPAGASPSPYPALRAPFAHETALEMPWRLFLSPHAGLGWAHATGLVTRNGRTEVWHTRLGQRVGNAIDEWNANDRTVRAVWSRDNVQPYPSVLNLGNNVVIPLPLANNSPLTPADRVNIVAASADGTKGWAPKPVQVNRLMLTPLGGYLDVEAVWDEDHPILEWQHRSTLGRDHYVRVVNKGYLFPFGHPAARITISERRFAELNGQTGGFLIKEEFVAVRRPLKNYAGSLQPNGGRAWPFRAVRFTTLITPVIDTPPAALGGVNGAFIVNVDGAPFPWHVAVKDWEGRDSNFTTPLVFVPETLAFNAGNMQSLVNFFNNQSTDGPLRQRSMSGQKVALAESDEPGDTAMELDLLVMGAAAPAAGATQQQLLNADQPRFYPALSEFAARLSSVAQTSAGEVVAQRFNLGPYITEGFGPGNRGGLFAVLVGQVASATFGADNGGGLITPDFDPKAVSRVLGAVGGDVQELQDAVFDPEKFFKPGFAKLLGGIDLASIVSKVDDFLSNKEQALKITTRIIQEDPNNPLSRPIAVTTDLQWTPVLRPDPLKLFEPDPGSLKITAKFHQDLVNLDESSYEIEGDLREFKLNLIGESLAFMVIRFDRLQFLAKSGQKTDLKPVVDTIEFKGALEFVNRIQEFLTFGGSGPYIRPDAKGLTAGYDLPLPQIPLGALMINNIALSASLFIPWSGAPARIRFGLSSREKPFDVTYSAIGGGGFFGIAFGLDGLEKFECALELGAYLSVDLGVVSGSITIAAGIYFFIEKVQDDGEEKVVVGLEAYIRFVGKVQALGLISISLEIYLGLAFQRPPPKLTGIAKAELKVKVLFISVSVKVTVKRTISATPNDPNFADLFDQSHWDEYVAAFA